MFYSNFIVLNYLVSKKILIEENKTKISSFFILKLICKLKKHFLIEKTTNSSLFVWYFLYYFLYCFNFLFNQKNLKIIIKFMS